MLYSALHCQQHISETLSPTINDADKLILNSDFAVKNIPGFGFLQQQLYSLLFAFEKCGQQ